MSKPQRKSNQLLQSSLLAKQAALVQCEEKILHLTDEIKQKAGTLKQLRASEKSERVANSRLVSRRSANETDLQNRPSDRGANIRLYTKMDLDVWAYPQVREWFNKNASDDDPFASDPYVRPGFSTGYTIRLEADYTDSHKGNHN